ncbi:MAG: aspartate aminotransferase family protein [Myxococcales bacterium]|nr:aspartate aminotransferase family protein [Myxococcales bacterium]
MTPNYAPAPLVFARGEGVWLHDTEGKAYLDFAAGIAVSALGHAHPALVRALTEQARSVLHVSNLWLNEPALRLAERLTGLSFADRVYFGNSGAEANEAAFKLARRYMRLVRGEDRYGFICMEKSFHGRTWAAITATGQAKYHEGFAPLVPGFSHVPFNDLAAVEAAIEPTTCAIVVEPLQGEGGVLPAAPGYLAGLRKLCDAHGILLIFDEVQTGVGRTGRWFGHEHAGVTPDIMTLAKGLAGGVPISAMVCTEAVAQGFAPGAHASTFGGNPLACRAGLAVVDTIEAEDLVGNTDRLGALLQAGLTSLEDRPGVIMARGQGLLQGLVVDTEVLDRGAVVAEARRLGLLVTLAGYDTIRLSPPLVVGRAHVEQAVELLGAAIDAVAGGK